MKNREKMDKAISADIKVLEYLSEKAGNRKTKMEAYLDLMYKANDGFVSPFLRKKESDLGSCQCHVNISDLASDWGWHRATVRSFLDRLEQFGQIERERRAKSVIITMTSLTGQPSSPDVVHDTPDLAMQLMDVLSDWIIGRSDTETVGASCGRLVRAELDRLAGSAAQSCTQGDAENHPPMIVSAEDAVKEKALGCIAYAAHQKVLRKFRFDDATPVLQFFHQNLGGEWDAFVDASKELSELVLGNKSSVPDFSTAEGRECLKSLRNPFLALVAKSQESF